jgi:hypothetical protein
MHVQRHAVYHDTKQRRVLTSHCSRNAAILRLAVIMELPGGACVATACGVEGSALVHERVPHLRVTVAEQHHGVHRNTDGPHLRLAVLRARACIRQVDSYGFSV